MGTIYKIAYNINNEITNYIVFSGSLLKTDVDDNIQKLFVDNPDHIMFQRIFDDEELSNIKEKNIQVYFSKHIIFIDDTIETVKHKLLLTMQEIDSVKDTLSYEEIYMFYQEYKPLDPSVIYHKLTNNGNLALTKERYIQFLLNIEDIDIDKIKEKEEYYYEDLIELQLEKSDVIVNKPFGQRITNIENEFPYVVNPFNIIEYTDFLEKYSEELVTTTNKSILVTTRNMYKNTIFLCQANYVFKHIEELDLSSEVTSKLYYPFLHRRSISVLSELQEQKQELLDETERLLSTNLVTELEQIQLYYDIFNTQTRELPYHEIGIKSVSLEVHPPYELQIPLEIVFKIIHATKQQPLIKYHPGKRHEKMYRLYSNKLSNNGKKLPFLNKPTIIKIIKQIGGDRGVHVYIEYEYTTEKGLSQKFIVICSFLKNGIIAIKSSFNVALSVTDINEILYNSTENVMSIVREYFEQSGYNFAEFSSIDSDNVNIVNMEYVANISMTKKLNLMKTSRCLTNIFNIVNSDISQGIVMRLKRVSNYNEMDSQEAYIIEKINYGSREQEIVEGLVDNYQMKPQEARIKLSEFVNSMQVIQDAFQRKKFKIRANPGFLTTITKELFSNNITVVVSGITSISYLESIPIYIDSMLRISEDPDASKISAIKIKEICDKKPDVTKKKESSDDDDDDDSDDDSDSDSDHEDKEIVAPLDMRADNSLHDMAKDLGIAVEEKQDDGKQTVAPNMLDMLMDSDDDDDSDSDDDSDIGSDDDFSGGGNIIYQQSGGDGTESDEEYKQDITGMSIANPNPFFKRMQNRDPVLFLKESEGKFNAYSRACQWTQRRQPVMLTDKEKEKIDREHPGSYHEAIKYGSDPEKQYWYICPRYWSLKDNTSLTEEEAKSGKYGTIIPANAKTVPPGGGIIEFTSKIHKDDKGNYIQHYPGFLKPDSHPDNLCLPCCFKSWDAPAQVKRRDNCIKDSGIIKPKGKKKSNITENYIMGSDKFPLEDNRYGYLPLSLQHFLNTNNSLCQISKVNTNLKRNHPCMLRHGVETSKTQSFIGCIADIWVDKTVKTRLSITEMKEVMISAIDIDTFLTLQNGALSKIFLPQELGEPKDYSKTAYSNSKLYKKIDFSKKSQNIFFHKTVLALENYIKYLKDDRITIDYKYVWDLICNPNPKLFTDGNNMIILDVPEDDVTENVNIICPTNHYSKQLFDHTKRTIILMKKKNYYEPIYLFEDTGSAFTVLRRFTKNIESKIPEVIKTIELIKLSMGDKCRPKNSMPKIYKFKNNIVLSEVLEILRENKYNIITQIINTSGLIIGIAVEDKKTKLTGIVPCYPSSPVLDIDYTFDEQPYTLTYLETKQFLNNIAQSVDNAIPCLPSMKIIEDKLIVGILTETNQFIVVQPEMDTYEDDLPKIEDTNYNNVDEIVSTNDGIDNERVRFIKKIDLESKFYSIFRNTIRILLGKYENIELRKKILALSKDTSIPYVSRIQETIDHLVELSKEEITFTEYDDDVVEKISNITNCNTKTCNKKKYCFTKTDKLCVLLLPKTNLIHGGDNEEMYYGRLADEMIRYTRIKTFMFKPQIFLTFKNINYNLKEDEVVVLESLLFDEYFYDVVSEPKNNYVTTNSYDTAIPLESQVYSKEDALDNYNEKYKKQEELKEADQKQEETSCPPPTKSNITGKWKSVFLDKSQDIIFNNDPPLCTFDVIIILIKYNDAQYSMITKEEVVNTLAMLYRNLGVENYNKILQIWKSQGKSSIARKVYNKETTIEEVVKSKTYYATNIDIWILATHYKLPIVFYTSTTLLENGDTLLLANDTKEDAYYFIKSPSVGINYKPKYRLVVSGSGKAKIPISELSKEIRDKIKANAQENALETFMKDFKLDDMKKRVPKKLVLKKAKDT